MTQLSPHLPTSDVGRMVDFYTQVGFRLNGEVYVKDGVPAFAELALSNFTLRIERWNLPDWDILKKGFSVTTLWIEVDSVERMAERLKAADIVFTGPHREDYGSVELECFDPEGFRIIFAGKPVPSTLGDI